MKTDRDTQDLIRTTTTGSLTYTLRMAYNAANRLTQLTYPSGTIVAYGRDAVGRINAVSVNGSPVVAGVSYAPFGPPELLSFGDGSTLARGVDKNYRTSQIVSSLSDGLKLYFEFDVLGNITRADNDALPNSTSPEQRAYSYDHVYRLTDIRTANAALIERFAYDKTGNRTEKQGSCATANYSYSGVSHRLSSVSGDGRSYDASGNTTFISYPTGSASEALSPKSQRGQEFQYDSRGRMVSSRTLGSRCLGCDSGYTFNYNARGERVEKTVISGLGKPTTTPSLYDESGHLLTELNGSDSIEIIWLEDLPVAVNRAGAVHYIHADHLGTPRAVVTSGTASKAIWQWDFLATATGSNAFGDLEANADLDADGTHFIFNLRFPGQQKDQTGLNYNYFRDYEPATGRYVESDPIGLPLA